MTFWLPDLPPMMAPQPSPPPLNGSAAGATAGLAAALPSLPDPHAASTASRPGFEVGHRFYEIGSPEGLAETDAYLVSGSGA